MPHFLAANSIIHMLLVERELAGETTQEGTKLPGPWSCLARVLVLGGLERTSSCVGSLHAIFHITRQQVFARCISDELVAIVVAAA